MSASPAARAGRLDALRRIAEHGAAKGWDRLEPLIADLVRIAIADQRRLIVAAASPDRSGGALPERAAHTAGWCAGVLAVAEAFAERRDLAAFVRRAVLDAELETYL